MWFNLVQLFLLTSTVHSVTLVKIHFPEPNKELFSFDIGPTPYLYADVYGGIAKRHAITAVEELFRVYPCVAFQDWKDSVLVYGTCTGQQMFRLEANQSLPDGGWTAEVRQSNKNCQPKPVEGFVMEYKGTNRTVNEESFDVRYAGMIVELMPYNDDQKYEEVRAKFPKLNQWIVLNNQCRCLDGMTVNYRGKWEELCPT